MVMPGRPPGTQIVGRRLVETLAGQDGRHERRVRMTSSAAIQPTALARNGLAGPAYATVIGALHRRLYG
jgi:hypothetical protein